MREDIKQHTDQAWNNLYERLEQDGLLTLEDARKEQTIGRSPALKWAVGIAAFVVGAVSIFALLHLNTPSAADTLMLHNAKGEPTLVTSFEDGSIIYLSEQASVEYPSHFAQDRREISLQGDAFFDVSKSPERPFIIHTQTAVIEVLGTSFNVKSKDDEAFSLSVRTGKVKVTSKLDNQTVFVNAGETALLQSAGLHTLPTSDLAQFNNYLRHIHFKDQTLGDIVRMINENTDSVQLKIAPELSDRRLTVTFRDNSPADMAQIICAGLGLELSTQQNILYINQQN